MVRVQSSTVGVFAILDPVNADFSGFGVGEADSIIPHAEAVFRGIDALEVLDIAGVSGGHPVEGGGQAEAGSLVQASEIGFGLIGKDQALHEGSL